MTRRIAITLGDPRGIGAEVVAGALRNMEVQQLAAREHVEFILVGPTGLPVDVHEGVGHWPGDANDIALAGRLAGRAIERAVELVSTGNADALVTAPIDKAALAAGGYDYPGHTEMLAALTGSKTVMLLASERLRVVLATTHVALRDVPRLLTEQVLRETIEITRKGMRAVFGLSEPRIALCALNPHAGDHGRFGDEDDRLLAPVARACGVSGPLPADTVFVRALQGEFDVVIAPYHDVGMTAIKVASFGSAVNVTLGLPFLRTSPDHGTALDIAGKGIARADSMVRAIAFAIERGAQL